MGNLKNIIPDRGIPSIPQCAKLRDNWFSPDTLDKYKLTGHPLYSIEDISYEFNEHGFRSPSFKVKADIKILTIGCSYVVGIGLPIEKTFHRLLAKRIERETGKSVVDWGMGHGGASNDWIARMVAISTRELKPDIVVVSFTDENRREFIDNEGKIYRYWPHWTRPKNLYGNKNVYETIDGIRNIYDDARNTWMNYMLIKSTLQAQNINWVWIHNGLSEDILNLMDIKRCAGQWDNNKQPLARDNQHPGPQASEDIADSLFSRMNNIGILSKWIPNQPLDSDQQPLPEVQ